MKKGAVIHHVFANRSNVGDWMSARGIQKLLAPLPVREHLCDTPFVRETARRLSEAGPRDWVVIGGGGLFMDYFVPFWKAFLKLADRLPFCIWGVGYCDAKHKDTRLPDALIRAVIAKSRLCIVRDELTRDHFLRIDPKLKIARPVACPSLSAVEPLAPGGALLHVNNCSTIGFPVYRKMRALGMRFAEETSRPYLETNNRTVGDPQPATAAVLKLYRSADLVLSSALHGCILSLGMGRKVLAVSADHKIDSFMRTAGLGDWVLDKRAAGSSSERLRDLHRQKSAAGFVRRARRDNEAAARQIRALIGAS